MDKLQPNSKHCFVCGVVNPYGLKLRFHQTGPGEVTVEYTVPEEYQGYPGVVHGGIVAAMLDEVTGRVFMGDNDAPRFMFTARLTLRYRSNVPVGQPLRIVGRAVKNRGRIATATGVIYDSEGAILAESEALLVDIPSDLVDDNILEELGWKLYPEDDEVIVPG